MSGCGRKHRAKHLVRQYLDDEAWEGPEQAGDELAVCVSAPSAKHVHTVLVTVPAGTRFGPPAAAAVAEEKKAEEDAPKKAEGEEEKKEVAAAAAAAEEEKEKPAVAEDKVVEDASDRFVASLPGKFNKVLWLGCGDLIVLRLGTVQYKPSPQQLKSFYASAEGRLWEPMVQKAEARARILFKKVNANQVVTTVATQNLSGGGKFVSRNDATTAGGNTPAMLTTVAAKPTAAKHSKVVDVDPLAGMMGDSDDDLGMLVNPNRQSIKHRRQAFFPDEDEEEEEEEEGEEEEGDE